MKYFLINGMGRHLMAGLAMVAALSGCAEDKKVKSTSKDAKTALKNAIKAKAAAGQPGGSAVITKDPVAKSASSSEIFAQDVLNLQTAIGQQEPTMIKNISSSYINFFIDEKGVEYLQTWHLCETRDSQDSEDDFKFIAVRSSRKIEIEEDGSLEWLMHLSSEVPEPVIVSSHGIESDQLTAMASACAAIGNSLIYANSDYYFSVDTSKNLLHLDPVQEPAQSLVFSKAEFE